MLDGVEAFAINISKSVLDICAGGKGIVVIEKVLLFVNRDVSKRRNNKAKRSHHMRKRRNPSTVEDGPTTVVPLKSFNQTVVVSDSEYRKLETFVVFSILLREYFVIDISTSHNLVEGLMNFLVSLC